MENRGIGIRLRMLNNAVRRYIDRNSDGKKQIESLTCSGGWIVGHVCEMERFGKEVYQRDLENDFGVTRSTASKVLALLEKKGWIARVSVPHDARLKKIVPTEKSREFDRTIQAEADKFEEKLKEGFSEQELNVLFGYFERIQKNLDAAEQELRGERN